jgi:hypothetical protein
MICTYKGMNFNSKANVIHYMYDKGELTNDADSKKNASEQLSMTVQAVYAILKKYVDSKPKTIDQPKPEKKSIETRTSEINLKRNVEPIIKNSKDISENNIHRFFVIYAPNPWRLPVTNPPIQVIDERFDNTIDIYPDVEEKELEEIS